VLPCPLILQAHSRSLFLTSLLPCFIASSFSVRPQTVARNPRPFTLLAPREVNEGSLEGLFSLPTIATVRRPLPDYFPSPPKPFRINTYKSVTKQTSLTSFGMNTYEKHRGEGVLLLTRNPMGIPVLSDHRESRDLFSDWSGCKFARAHDSLSRLARMRHNPRARGSIQTNSRARRIQ
jgi:hypothetical protein